MTGKASRRGHNEGGIYQRASDGKWVGAVHLGWEDGKRKRKVVYGKTRAEVNQKVIRIQADIEKGLPIQTASKSVAAFLDEWIEEVVKPTKSANTAKNYELVVNRRLNPAIGKHKLDKLTQRHIQTMMNQWQVEGVAIGTITQYRAILRAALNQAMRWDLVGRNVASLTELPSGERFEGYGVSTTEVRAIMANVAGDDLEALYGIVTSVGPRIGELLGLRWVDVDLDSGVIRIRRQLQVIDGKPQLVDLKSRSSRRDISLPPPVFTLLKSHRKRQIAQRLQDGVPFTEEGYVFAWRTGGSLSDSHVRDHWHALRERAGLPGRVRFHDLRHGALSILANRGTPPRTLMGIAGHSNISTTMQFYTHLDADNVREATTRMSDLYEAETGAK